MEYTNEYGNFSSNGKGNLGVTLGAIGTGLGILNGGNCGNGILGGLFGGNNNCCSEDHCVNRYELAMQNELASKDSKIALLESNIYVDSKISDVYERLNNKISVVEGQIAQQAVFNATTNSTLGCIANQVAQLQSLTKLVVPNTSVCPGWGNVTVTPATTTTGA